MARSKALKKTINKLLLAILAKKRIYHILSSRRQQNLDTADYLKRDFSSHLNTKLSSLKELNTLSIDNSGEECKSLERNQ
mmetsp:Transcript_5106/g.5934  ORF Transcript_5106/g.5934 Transcript_5106/m.5934 type:complete len:80 (+) Transcript_5106:1423-1662(+)